MDLHTGRSLWQANNSQVDDEPVAAGDLACEVAVVGGGITGALVAYYLASEGVNVLLVDKRQPCEGSTSMSTGLLQYEVDIPLSSLIRQVGEERAVHAYRRGVWAVDELQSLTESLPEACGYSRRESLYFSSHWWHAWALKREYDCRHKHGLPVKYLNRRQLAGISSISSAGAIMSSGDAQVDPLALTRNLLQAAKQKGVRVFGHSEVKSNDEQAEQIVLYTPQARIQANSLVIAPGYESRQFFGSTPGNLLSTYAMASEPIASFPGWPDGWLLWETARPYFYARQSSDGRAIIGGGDTAFSNDHERDGLVERKAQSLLKRFEILFPDIEFTPAYTWAGTFAETKDGLAYIGRPRGKPRTYAALGYGGNGITYGVIAARLIADLICGRPNRDADVFSFER